RQRALLVRARIVERNPVDARAADADRASLDLDPAQRAVGDVASGPDRMPARACRRGHGTTVSGGAAPKSRVSSSGGTPWCSAACAAALSTFWRRVASRMANQTAATTTRPIAQYPASQL